MAKNVEDLKGFLVKVKEKSEKKNGLNFNIQINIMAPGSITSFQIGGKQWKQ